MRFNFFFRSLGNEQIEYNYPLGSIESENIQEVVQAADFICQDMNIPVHQIGVDLNAGRDYPRQQTSTTGVNETGFKKFLKNYA